MKGFRASLTGGNGSIAPDADRLERMEEALTQIPKALETQFARISELQAQVDRLVAERRDTRR